MQELFSVNVSKPRRILNLQQSDFDKLLMVNS